MSSFFVTVLVLIRIIDTFSGQGVLDEANQQVLVIYKLLIEFLINLWCS